MRVAVLMGGFSSEREISLRSGAAVADALRSRGFTVLPVDVRDERVEELAPGCCDAAFVALHGRFGEDGGIQTLCEARELPYTGSGPRASRLALDKVQAKELFVAAGLSTSPWRVCPASEGCERARAGLASLGLPVVVKPRAEGSSVGVSIVREAAALDAALTEAWRFGPDALVERFVAGAELTVGILGERALPLVELRPRREFFDYQAKYQDTRTEYVVAPPLDPEATRRVQEAGLGAHRALGCKGFSRVDVMLPATGEPMLLEVNTIPGMTERSLFPKAARAAGISFAELCDRLVQEALSAVARPR
ncbi:MAG: D-alanine--D-alanine ligase [Planctomycetes bacterium]|nr:D-alanine--D-alanine ligase [Planctomycetota bacterium]